MSRLTTYHNGKAYILDTTKISSDNIGYYGDAIEKIAKLENLYDDLLINQQQVIQALEELKLQDKSKSCKSRELLVKKLTNNNILSLLNTYDLQ